MKARIKPWRDGALKRNETVSKTAQKRTEYDIQKCSGVTVKQQALRFAPWIWDQVY